MELQKTQKSVKQKLVYVDTHKMLDEKGNVIIVSHEKVYNTKRLSIHLASESKRRTIGDIDLKNRVLFVKRNKSKHFHYKMHSYGFNWYVINRSKQFDSILMMLKDGDDVDYFRIPVDFIKSHGVVKNFSQGGFELQVFIRVEYLNKFRTSDKFTKVGLVASKKKDPVETGSDDQN